MIETPLARIELANKNVAKIRLEELRKYLKLWQLTNLKTYIKKRLYVSSKTL